MNSNDSPNPPDSDRREFLATTTTVAMAGGLGAGYGMVAIMAGRFLYSSASGPVGRMFVARVDDIAIGQSIEYVSPIGQRIVIACLPGDEGGKKFIALSSVCPHLGCRVHWQQQEDRFFCPCHNGAFDAQGRATAGPPAADGQNLSTHRLYEDTRNGLLYIEVPLEGVITT